MKRIFVILSLAVLFICSAGTLQNRTISGIVSDNYGNVLPGVTVVIKGTSRGTVTDVNGKYSLEIKQGDATLVFAFVGMITEEVRIGTSNTINVVMREDLVVLEESIVVGYGSRSRIGKALESVTGGPRNHPPSPAYYVVADYDFNTESYSAVNETGFKDVLQNPLSTFSIDVDNASYSNMRRFINGGQLPPADAIRTEELLNYFSYNYPEPTDGHPFAVYTELSDCPWNSKHQLLHVGLKGKSIDKDELPLSNLVFLIDVSGSMNGPNRLPLVKTSMKMLVNELRPEDRVSIVVYASRTEVVLESTPARKKQTIISAIEQLQAGGYTAGGQALRMAYEVAEKNFIKNGNNRIIIATDGDFNVGESSNAAMERLVEEERKKGIFITVLGFGMGNIKDDRLEIIANKGNGNYGYIDNIQEARKILVSEFAGTLFTIAKDVKFQIEFNPARVKGYRLIGYENRRLNDEDFNNDTKDAGEMGAGHSVTALYEIILAGSNSPIPGVDPLKYQQNPVTVNPDPAAELLTLKLRYKKPDGDKSILIDRPVQGKPVPLAKASDDFRFAASIAEFGMILRDSPYKADSKFENVLKLAATARGEDNDGYRAEFINLVRTSRNLKELRSEN